MPRIETLTRVVVIQHPRERDVPIGTARMATLCLPNSELHVVTSVAGSNALARALSDPARPAILLSPGEGAKDIVRDPPRLPVTLVVVDGTWSQAKKIIKNDPALRALPRYAFAPPAPSEYRIRREPAETYVSTIEALVYTLGALEGDATRFDALLAPFRAMVDFQIEHARLHMSRHKHPRGVRPPKPRLPILFTERARDLVCVVGEANAWPYTSPLRARYPEELVHWTAVRISTGERFEAILAPLHPLAPGTLRWIELDEPTLRAGSTAEDLATRWRAFAKPTDLIASWGTYATKIFESSGIPLSRPRLDLREAARMFSRGKVGTLEELATQCSDPNDLPKPTGPGRANRRLGHLETLVAYLQNRTDRSDPNDPPEISPVAEGPGTGPAGPT